MHSRTYFLRTCCGKHAVWRYAALAVCLSLSLTISTAALAQQAPQNAPPCTPPKTKAPARSACCASPGSPESGNATAFVVQQPATTDSKGRLEALVPLLQSGLWAVLMGAGLIGFRKEIGGLIDRAKSVDLGGVKIDTEPESVQPLSTAMPENVPVRVRLR